MRDWQSDASLANKTLVTRRSLAGLVERRDNISRQVSNGKISGDPT